MTLTFDELAKHLDSWQGQPIRAEIQNNTRRYYFHSLKPNVSLNPDVCGVGLNHAYQSQFGVKKSRFHDSEDVCIDFKRNEIDVIRLSTDKRRITVVCKTFTCWLRID